MKSRIIYHLVSMVFFLLSLGNASAQSSDRQLLSTSGNLQTSGSIRGSWTVGEVMVQKFDVSGYNLTQGFQQYYLSESCLGDLDGNGLINTNDLLLLLSNYGCAQNCFADLTGDGIVSTNDLLLFLTVFGTVCP